MTQFEFEPDNIIALKRRQRVGAVNAWEQNKNVTAE